MIRSIEAEYPRFVWVLGLVLLFVASPAYSQSLADIARQERERKLNEPARATHVYTNDDLAKPQILVPEDHARVRSGERTKPASNQPAAESTGDEPTDNVPLGDVARQDRARKEAAQNLELPSPSPPLVVSTPPLAYPKFDKPAGSIAFPAPPVRIVSANNDRSEVTRGEEIAGGTRICVQSGDTLWGLAKKYLGRGEDWVLLAVANPKVSDPTRLWAGTWVRLPDRSQPVSPRASIPVKQGDTLWKLTEKYFGNGEAWLCLAQANPQIKNTAVIFVGQTLTIPEDCAATALPQVPNLSVSSKSLPSSTAGTP
jgi:nucleoid-associated protein YgaU